MKPVTIYVSEKDYFSYQLAAKTKNKTAAELIRDAMTFFLKEKLQNKNAIDDWQPLSLGDLISDYADNNNREEMIDARY